MRSHGKRIEESGLATVAAIAEPSTSSVDAFQESTGTKPAVYADYREMLTNEKLDCALVGSPHTLHLQHITAALRAGLHVLTEKPMVCSVAEAQTLLDVVATSGKVFMISYQRHFDQRFLWIKQQIESGALGRLTYISAVLLQEWLYAAAGTWRQDPALSGGGQLNDSGTHFIDVLNWIGGPAQEVHAFIDNRGKEVDVNSTVNIKFKNGALASMDIVGDAHGYWEDWSFSAEKGTILYRNGKLYLMHLGEGLREIGPAELPASPGDVDRVFIDTVLGHHEPPIPGRIGLEVINVTECIWKSGAEGRPVQVPTV